MDGDRSGDYSLGSPPSISLSLLLRLVICAIRTCVVRRPPVRYGRLGSGSIEKEPLALLGGGGMIDGWIGTLDWCMDGCMDGQRIARRKMVGKKSRMRMMTRLRGSVARFSLPYTICTYRCAGTGISRYSTLLQTTGTAIPITQAPAGTLPKYLHAAGRYTFSVWVWVWI